MNKRKYKYTNTPLPPQLRRHKPFSGYIIIRLIDKYAYKEGSDLFSFVRDSQGNSLSSIIDKVKSKPQAIERLINHISVQELKAIEEIASKSDLPPLRSLSTYWKIDYRNTTDSLYTIVKAFNSFGEVDFAYRELLVYDPTENENPGSFDDRQTYLNSGIEGIDAKWLWTQEITGQEVGLIDLEQGWEFPHLELPNIRDADLIANDNADTTQYENENGVIEVYAGDHGIKALSLIVATDNKKGIKGIAPETKYVKLASHHKNEIRGLDNVWRRSNGYIEDAILKTISKLINGEVNTGDILLLEVEKIYYGNIKLPVEVEFANFDAIRLASALGFVVIEAAGNGNSNLGVSRHMDIPKLNQNEDSGAIMVAAAISIANEENTRVYYRQGGDSNHGKRIDCFAPIQGTYYRSPKHVVAGGIGNVFNGRENIKNQDYQDNRYNNYSDDFGGSSAASAIIAGAAILLQSAYKQRNKIPLSPLQMRYLLSDPRNGTVANTEYTVNADGIFESSSSLINETLPSIGVMPNLRKIIEVELCLLPDVYIRKNTADSGEIPFLGSIDCSPDIIVIPQNSALLPSSGNPFGPDGRSEPSVRENITISNNKVNYIYVRIWNRGLNNVENVELNLYWRNIESSVYDWTLAGVLRNITVTQDNPNADNRFKVRPQGLPSRGNFYLIAIVRQLESDNLFLPTRSQGTESNFEELLSSEHTFQQFVRNNNNVACLKFTLP